MSKYLLVHDPDDCIGCQACEVHCKTNKGLGPGPAPCKIVTVGPFWTGDRPRVRFVHMPCFHCEEPWCAKVCPKGAIQKRRPDGIVFIQPSLCVGCKSCILACPWGAVQWDPGLQKPVKCDFCKDRLDAGLQPACVEKCVTRCLRLLDATAAPGDRRRKYARSVAAAEAAAGDSVVK